MTRTREDKRLDRIAAKREEALDQIPAKPRRARKPPPDPPTPFRVFAVYDSERDDEVPELQSTTAIPQGERFRLADRKLAWGCCCCALVDVDRFRRSPEVAIIEWRASCYERARAADAEASRLRARALLTPRPERCERHPRKATP